MDVELQVLKHLARDPHSIAPVIDEYCAEYKDLFKEVRSYECFKYLHHGANFREHLAIENQKLGTSEKSFMAKKER